jgi:hypothetical protein
MNPAVYPNRQLMQNLEDSSNKDNHNVVAWCLVLLPVIFIIATGALLCWKRRQQIKEYQLRNFEFVNWNPDFPIFFQDSYNDGLKRTPLQIAIQVNNLLLVQHILKNPDSQKVEVDDLLRTSLHYAAQYADPSILEEIIDKTPSPLQRDHKGQTALHYAALRAKNNETQALKILLEQSNYIPDQLTQDHKGHTFLHTYALEKRQGDHYDFPQDLHVQRAFVNSIKNLLDPEIYLIADHDNLKLNCLVPTDEEVDILAVTSDSESDPSKAESTSGNRYNSESV